MVYCEINKIVNKLNKYTFSHIWLINIYHKNLPNFPIISSKACSFSMAILFEVPGLLKSRSCKAQHHSFIKRSACCKRQARLPAGGRMDNYRRRGADCRQRGGRSPQSVTERKNSQHLILPDQ